MKYWKRQKQITVSIKILRYDFTEILVFAIKNRSIIMAMMMMMMTMLVIDHWVWNQNMALFDVLFRYANPQSNWDSEDVVFKVNRFLLILVFLWINCDWFQNVEVKSSVKHSCFLDLQWPKIEFGKNFHLIF